MSYVRCTVKIAEHNPTFQNFTLLRVELLHYWRKDCELFQTSDCQNWQPWCKQVYHHQLQNESPSRLQQIHPIQNKQSVSQELCKVNYANKHARCKMQNYQSQLNQNFLIIVSSWYYTQEQNTVVKWHSDPEVVSMHSFTLATMVVCLRLIINTITVKISVGFFGFRVIQRNTRSGKTLFIKF